MVVLRAVGVNLAVFFALFLLHIVFAAAGVDAGFRLVAVLISIQAIAFAPLTALLVGPCEASVRRTVALRSLTIGVPLAFGLAWAYGGMAWSLPETVGIVGGSLVVYAAFDRFWARPR